MLQSIYSTLLGSIHTECIFTLKSIHACVFIYIYTQHNYTQYTDVLCKHKLLFWMRLIVAMHSP